MTASIKISAENTIEFRLPATYTGGISHYYAKDTPYVQNRLERFENVLLQLQQIDLALMDEKYQGIANAIVFGCYEECLEVGLEKEANKLLREYREGLLKETAIERKAV